MIGTLALAEIKRRLLSPGFWLLLALLFLLLALLFLSLLEYFVTTLQPANLVSAKPITVSDGVLLPYLWWAGVLVPGLMPLLALAIVGQERQQHSWVLLQLAPLRPTTVILAKFLSLAMLATVIVVCVALPGLLLALQVKLDSGQLLSGLCGLWLFSLAAAALSLYFSSRLRDPLAGALASYALLLLLGLFFLLANVRGIAGSAVHFLASYTHFQPWLEGRFDSLHLAYFLLLTALFMALTLHRAQFAHLRGH